MASLFGPTPAEIMMARQKEQQQMNMLRQQQISQEGGQFGAFAPLYQAGLRFGDVGAQAMRQRMFPEQVDPMLQKATAIQGVLAKYQGQDLNSAEVMSSIASDLSSVDMEAGLKAGEIARKLQKEGGKISLSVADLERIDPAQRAQVIADYQATGKLPSDVRITGSLDKDLKIKTPADFAIAGQALGIPVKPEVGGYTKEETQAIEDKLNTAALNKAAASAARLNFDTPSDQFKAIKIVNDELKPFAEKLTGISNAVALTNNSRSAFDQKGFETMVGDVFGGKVRAQAEIERLRNSGNLGQRLENTFSLFLTGKIGDATKDDQMEVLLTLYEENAKQHDLVASPFRTAAKDKADSVAPLAKNRYELPKLSNNRQYIPMSVVRTKGIQKGQTLQVGNQQFTYNGDGTVSPVKGQ
jgi:hypothetical protein